MKIFISAGHSNKKGKDQGAQANGYSEGVLAVMMRDVLVKEIVTQGGSAVVDDPSLITVETVGAWKKKIGAGDVAIDLHFNASSNSTVDGVEVIVPAKPSESELKLADFISDVISEETGSPERGKIGKFDGVKLETETARKQLAWMTLPGTTVLVEFQFLTDKVAMSTLLSKTPQIMRRLAAGLVGMQRSAR